MIIKTITIDPIWVWAIFDGLKLVENRSWKTSHRGDLAIHAGLNRNREKEAREWIKRHTVHTPPDSDLLRERFAGRLFGVVELVDCVDLSDVPEREREFAEGPVCWRISNPREFNDPRLIRGKLGLWSVDTELNFIKTETTTE